MEKLKKIFIHSIPYLMLLVMTLLVSLVLFHKGIFVGDDIKYHLSNIMDEYLSLSKGHGLSPISANLANGLGVGNRLFYSPLPHITVTIMYILLKWTHLSLIGTFKLVIILSIYISGILMYRLMMHITNNKKIASFIAAGIYILYPYRLFDAYCRMAFAEAYSFMFLPLFIMGLYDICHMEQLKIKPFIEVILGGSLLFLSHNLTAFYCYIIGIIYLIAHVHKLWKYFKKPMFWCYCATSIFILIGLISIPMFSSLELMHSGAYNISNAQRMWTTAENLFERTFNFFDYSGFLNITYLSGSIAQSDLIFGVGSFIFITVLFIFADNLFQKWKKIKFAHIFLSGAIYFLLSCLFADRIEYGLACIIVFVCYAIITFLPQSKEESEFVVYKKTDFWFSIGTILILLIFISNGEVWKYVPKILLNIQFSWRLFSFVQLFVAIGIGMICAHTKWKKIFNQIGVICMGLLMVTSMPLIEKRLLFESQKDVNHSDSWIMEVDSKILHSGVGLGFNKEYCPQVFFDDNYQSKYENSLYSKVKRRLPYDFNDKNDYDLKPVVLEGTATIDVKKAYAPTYQMEIEVSETSLIQMPLIYYPGYQIELISNGKTQNIKAQEIDGLVAFKLQIGTYKVTTKYVGTTIRKVSYGYTIIAIVGLASLVVLYIIFDQKKKLNKEKIKG